MLALDIPLYRLSIRAMLGKAILHAHHSLLPSSVEESQDEHGENRAIIKFGNPIIGRLVTGFPEFLQNF